MVAMVRLVAYVQRRGGTSLTVLMLILLLKGVTSMPFNVRNIKAFRNREGSVLHEQGCLVKGLTAVPRGMVGRVPNKVSTSTNPVVTGLDPSDATFVMKDTAYFKSTSIQGDLVGATRVTNSAFCNFARGRCLLTGFTLIKRTIVLTVQAGIR